jgi:translation initiation factor IF-3
MAHQELGAKLLQRVKADLEDHGQVEQFPKMEGRQMVMVVAPLRPEEKLKREKMKAEALAREEA